MLYSNFIQANPTYKQLESDPTIEAVYDYLSLPNSVYEMIEACKRGKSALSGVVVELEKMFPDLLQVLPNNKNFIKQAIGVIIKHILSSFGYAPTKPVRIPRNLSNFFSSAHTYELREELAKFQLVATFEIQPIQPVQPITEELNF